eukprot:1192984-Prorocentrum_minimum.AAC.1
MDLDRPFNVAPNDQWLPKSPLSRQLLQGPIGAPPEAGKCEFTVAGCELTVFFVLFVFCTKLIRGR